MSAGSTELPLVTIITPTYNRAHILRRTIDSVLRQTFADWELLIADDASADNTESVVRSYSDTRIRYFKHAANLGNAGARNTGVKSARGEFITFVDSDDELEPEFLAAFIRESSRMGSAFQFGFCGYTIVRANGELKKELWIPVPGESFLKNLKIGIGCGVFIRKTCFEKAGLFDERLRVAVDTDWLIRLEQDFTYTIVREHLLRIHFHEGDRVRRSSDNLLRSYALIFEKNATRIYQDRETLYKFLYKLQWLNYHADRIVEGNRMFYDLRKNGLSTKKAWILFVIFNFLPRSIARRLHKRDV